MNELTVEKIGLLITSLGKKDSLLSDLIPNFTTRFGDTLEQCLQVPFIEQEQRPVYPTLVSKVSILFYRLIKDQPFVAHNKRIALAVMLYTLADNRRWLKVEQTKLLEFVNWIHSSPLDAQEEVVKYIEKFLKNHMVPFEE